MSSDAARYVALTRPAPEGTPLALGPGPLQLAWLHPEARTWAVGLGVAGERLGPVRELGEALADLPGPFFGGWAFDPARPWDGFAAERWILPQVLGRWTARGAFLTAFAPEGTSEAELAARLSEVAFVPVPSVVPRATRTPAAEAPFHALVEAALAELHRGGAKKLVVARRIEVEAERPWDERQVLAALADRFPTCRTFLVRGLDGSAFVGASPELLCEVRAGLVRTEALAGTAAPEQGEWLRASPKDRFEHQLVVDHLREVLGRLGVGLELATEPGLRRLANVVHLSTPALARLRPGVAAFELARALHPTPAVAGVPVASALGWLAEYEGFARGWYTGAVGAAGEQGLELAVALRSARLSGSRGEVFVGAGVVEGSTPGGEWEETERKAQALLPALGVARG